MYKLGTAPTQLVMNCLETFMAFFFFILIPVFISTVPFLSRVDSVGAIRGAVFPRYL